MSSRLYKVIRNAVGNFTFFIDKKCLATKEGEIKINRAQLGYCARRVHTNKNQLRNGLPLRVAAGVVVVDWLTVVARGAD
ncbi:Uncharacterised protein [Yersinia frederiksenii]|nr:Uncharacterised protein [Yersinia frederiksenii]CNI48046.1 Uncharacterised protein [Yersinia frederiksenii]CNK99004.1 Uncharacterised protein [Yersinia frederiksenii]